MSFINDFKEFAFKGNLIDMAVGLVMGTAVAAMCKSFIDNIIMPLIASVAKLGDMSAWKIPLGTEITKVVDGKEQTVQAALEIGSFVEEVINFAILAFVIFVALKIAAGWMKKAEEEAPTPIDIELLTEIRDSLRK